MSLAPKARGPRRTPRESAEFRERIIAVARALFVEQGFEAVSIRKIAERAGCPPMTFYVAFRSKRELLRHIWEDVFADLLQACAAAVEAASGAEAKLVALFRAMSDYWLAHPDNYRVVFMHQDKVASSEEAYYVESSGIQDRLKLVDAIIADGVAERVFAPSDPALSAQVVLVAMVGLAHALVTIPEFPWLRDHLTERTIAILIGGLKTPTA